MGQAVREWKEEENTSGVGDDQYENETFIDDCGSNHGWAHELEFNHHGQSFTFLFRTRMGSNGSTCG